jgi:hypothetical protein
MAQCQGEDGKRLRLILLSPEEYLRLLKIEEDKKNQA